ncbi:MAG: hypothetical protein AB7G47_20245 [Mycolicibacterium sp.]|uniref:hypothetical protein n=1 Tax=Mycolicibacterium sp. TaxID=2320850 RepID=UPI003D0B192E
MGQHPADDSARLLTLRDIATRMGWTPKTASNMQYRANRNRANGTPRPGDLPEPDQLYSGRPVWHIDTITAWETSRPGPGAGGGRPRIS